MLIQLAVRNLFRNPRRTLAIFMTIAVGSASLLVFRGFNAGIMNQYRENTIHARYGYGQLNVAGYREKVFEKPWEHWITNWPEIQAKVSQVPGVTHLFPRVEFFSLLTNGRITVSGRGQGVDGAQEAGFFNTLNVEEGVTLSEQVDGIVLGRGLARALDVQVGDRVTVLGNTIHGSMNGLDLTVVGIFHTGAKEFDDVVFRIQLAQAQVLLDTDRIESVALGLRSVEDWAAVAEAVRAGFPGLEATPFAVLDKVYYQNSVDWLGSQFGIIQLIILTIVLLGIFNTVSTSILERKQEIGNLRANGEAASDVLLLLLSEGVALGAAGALLGVLAALGLDAAFLREGILMPPAPGLTRQFHVKLEFDLAMAMVSFSMGALAAILGTFLAGIRVVRLPIGEALRST